MDSVTKKEAILTLTNSAKGEALKYDLHDSIKEVITNVIEYFTTKVNENINQIQKGLINKSSHFVDKTRGNLGRGLLQNLLKKNWDLLPSIHATMDSFTQSDAIHVLEGRNNATRSKVIDLESRIDYLESKAQFPGILLLTKIFSDSDPFTK